MRAIIINRKMAEEIRDAQMCSECEYFLWSKGMYQFTARDLVAKGHGKCCREWANYARDKTVSAQQVRMQCVLDYALDKDKYDLIKDMAVTNAEWHSYVERCGDCVNVMRYFQQAGMEDLIQKVYAISSVRVMDAEKAGSLMDACTPSEAMFFEWLPRTIEYLQTLERQKRLDFSTAKLASLTHVYQYLTKRDRNQIPLVKAKAKDRVQKTKPGSDSD